MKGLRSFLARVRQRSLESLQQAAFASDQQELLQRAMEYHGRASRVNPYGDPLALVYFIARAWGRDIDGECVELGSFAWQYLLAADLIDDVQDDDLAGKPFADAGPALAINGGLALLFLALHHLRLSGGGADLSGRLELFNRVSLAAVAGQHRDLVGAKAVRTPAEVLAMHEAKTSSLVLLVECGALLARVDDQKRGAYRALGARLACLVQILDDLRDLFGKNHSADLAAGRMTYPLACFFELADESSLAYFRAIKRTGAPEGELRRLLYESGAVRRAAAKLEELREEIHRTIGGMGQPAAAHRTILDIIDGLVGAVYRPRPLAETRMLWQPVGGWHREVREHAVRFRFRVKGALPIPPLIPWHLPQWQYDPRQQIVRYPDLEAQAEEILPFCAEMMASPSEADAASTLRVLTPALLAHELFHCWRDRVGRLSNAHWHEEYAANRLTVAYCWEHEPQVLAEVAAVAPRVLERSSSQVHDFVRQAASRDGVGTGYRLSLADMTAVQLAMVQELARSHLPLPVELQSWLGVTGTSTAAE